MSYHHFQRAWDHLEPIRDKSKQGKFSGAHRHEKLSPTALALAYALAELTDPRTGICSYSVRQIVAHTGLSSAGVRSGLEQLVERGIYERQRNSRRQKFTYRLKLECPPDCQKLEQHNPPGQIPKFESANKQHTQAGEPDTQRAISLPTERANKQLSDVLPTSTLKEIKEIKKKDTPCSFCRREPEDLSQLVIHSDNCSELSRIKNSPSWQYAISNYERDTGESWIGLSPREQQIYYREDLNRGLERKHAKQLGEDLETQKREEKLDLLIAGDLILPNWRIWLSVRFREVPDRIDEDLASAKKFSALGEDVELGIAERGASWWKGRLGSEVAQ